MSGQALFCAAAVSTSAVRLVRPARRASVAFLRAVEIHRTRRALAALPDGLLADVGLTRADIKFAARALVDGAGDSTRDPRHPINRTAALRAA